MRGLGSWIALVLYICYRHHTMTMQIAKKTGLLKNIGEIVFLFR